MYFILCNFPTSIYNISIVNFSRIALARHQLNAEKGFFMQFAKVNMRVCPLQNICEAHEALARRKFYRKGKLHVLLC